MMHGQATPQLAETNPKAARIAMLSAEYLEADATRRTEIGEEIEALISGRLLPFPTLRQ